MLGSHGRDLLQLGEVRANGRLGQSRRELEFLLCTSRVKGLNRGQLSVFWRLRHKEAYDFSNAPWSVRLWPIERSLCLCQVNRPGLSALTSSKWTCMLVNSEDVKADS